MKDETKAHMDSTASQFRQVAGLPERKNDKPSDPLEPSELRRQAEPEKGYGGKGETEVDPRAGVVEEELLEEQAAGEELSAKSGQGVTTAADASTSTEATEKQADAAGGSKKPATKAAAKKGK